ncbi:hypothetical protein [Zavarzinella formosa]|uniref:hypothetical protein n=1 Tax=Zavarzinella formosa TaxID=360055 RepID=UPI0003702FCA|nr:hypothetical protein [Zavarzinella formosa]
MFKSLWWWLWMCPRTEEAVAADFLHCQNPPSVHPGLASGAYEKDFTRRIAYIYGLGRVTRVDRVTGRDDWAIGWNRRLLKVCGAPFDPQATAERILGRVRELARLLPSGLGTNAKESVSAGRWPQSS